MTGRALEFEVVSSTVVTCEKSDRDVNTDIVCCEVKHILDVFC